MFNSGLPSIFKRWFTEEPAEYQDFQKNSLI